MQTSPRSGGQELSVIPLPASMECRPGEMRLDRGVRVEAGPGAESARGQVEAILAARTGGGPSPRGSGGAGASVSLDLDTSLLGRLGDE